MSRQESADVLADELEATEAELFDARGQLFEEVALCKVLTDELVASERDCAATNDAFWLLYRNHFAAMRKKCDELSQLHDEIDALQSREAKRGRWLPVALAVAVALGGYVGFLLGVAS